MIFNTPKSPHPDYEKTDYSLSSTPPRCSLDFKIFIEDDDGKVSVIGDTQLRLQDFKGHESLSQPFEFELELRANDYFTTHPYGELLTPKDKNTYQFDFNKLLGANATILLGSPETDNDVNKGKYPSARPVIFFNGIITNFSLADRGVYHATLKPALFKLTLQNSYRLFPDCTILDVVKQVLTENNIAFNKTELDKQTDKVIMGLATYRKQDWLQAGESDFDFITRLMNKVSLFYYFTHTENSHTMVISDQPHYKTIYKREVNKDGYNKETDTIKPLYLSYTQQASLDRDDYITQFKYQQNLTTNGLTTVLAQKESTWESQNTAQTSPIFLDRDNQKEKLNMEQMHIVQYGASKDEIGKITNTTMNKLAAAKYDFSGSSSCAELKAGHKFQVQEAFQSTKDATQQTIRPLLNNREFVATSVQHQASALGDYKNQFSAVAAEGLATPFNPHGGHQGTILARVTPAPTSKQNATSTSDNSGIETIDHTGSSAKQLEKTVFAYDSKDFSYELADDKSNAFSCRGVYVRFIDQPETGPAQWVKISEQMTTIPEVGVYVVVSRSQDSNEIPEIQQTLEAKGSKNIMPEGYSTHTSVGNNYNTSYGNSTGVSFGADITTPLSTATNIVNTQRATNNYNDVRYSESSSYSYNVTKHSHNISRTGSGAALKFDPADMMGFVSYGDSATYGNTYNKSKHIGTSTNFNNTIGASTSSNSTIGASSSFGDTSGVSVSVNTVLGSENNASTKTGVFTNASNINGQQINGSIITGNSISDNSVIGNNTSVQTTLGNNTSTTVLTGNTTDSRTTIGNSTSTTVLTGNTTDSRVTIGNTISDTIFTGNSTDIKTTIGNSTTITSLIGNTFEKSTYAASHTSESQTAFKVNSETVAEEAFNKAVGNSNGADTKVADNSVTSVQSDNSLKSATAQNTVENVSAGTTTSNNTSVQTANHSMVTEIHAGVRTML
jgi:type VI secretion system secreted protein VgrG